MNGAWIRLQLREIERLQRGIVVQQSRADETLAILKAESALVLQKINDLGNAVDGNISLELEQAVKAVSLRAISIDQKVSDIPCSE